MRFKHFYQHDQMDCGPVCLRMVANYYGAHYSVEELRKLSGIGKNGTSLFGLSEAAGKIAFRATGVKISLEQLGQAELPCILHWRHKHFVVLYKIKRGKFYVADPALGINSYSKEELKKHWLGFDQSGSGLVLLLSPTKSFKKTDNPMGSESAFSFLAQYRRSYGKLFLQLILGLFFASCLQLITPFLTQSIVDVGIGNRDLSFVYLILIAQAMLFVGSTSLAFIRSWLVLHMTTRVNLSILSDFLAKVMRLPLEFFDTRKTGDIIQRMDDQRRIENFLTGTTVNTLFSILNLVVYGTVLAFYYLDIFYVFLASMLLYSFWVYIFFKRRRALDAKRFDNSSKNQSNIVELISGIKEIKLHNCEQEKRWQWEKVQANIFRYNTKSLSLNQYQQGGTLFINQAKNILIVFISAKAVIAGELTLGAMMAIQFIAGQLSSPIEQLLGLLQSYQDAKLSIERLREVHRLDDEESNTAGVEYTISLPQEKSLCLNNISFGYPGADCKVLFSNINLTIPAGKTTAIVGGSGSGKTTILKLLMGFYKPDGGEIKVGAVPMEKISLKLWRDHCGMVMQDGFIFSDTLANNIAVGEQNPSLEKLEHAVRIANIQELVGELPLGYKTLIGSGGHGLSQGQKQRILIARAVYKNPDYIFLDEATNALDSNNERVIIDNLHEFFIGRTVVVVAHRLSTVQNAHHIIVVEKGIIVEQGNHEELITSGGCYYDLVKNQLQLSV